MSICLVDIRQPTFSEISESDLVLVRNPSRGYTQEQNSTRGDIFSTQLNSSVIHTMYIHICTYTHTLFCMYVVFVHKQVPCTILYLLSLSNRQSLFSDFIMICTAPTEYTCAHVRVHAPVHVMYIYMQLHINRIASCCCATPTWNTGFNFSVPHQHNQ